MEQTEPVDQPEAEGYELVMPFVACASAGGPFDDEAFVAGYQAGQVDQALAAAKVANASEVAFCVSSKLARQLELIGMKNDFPVMRVELSDETPDWANFTFRTEPFADSIPE